MSCASRPDRSSARGYVRHISPWEAPGQVTFALDVLTALATAGATIVAVLLARQQVIEKEAEKNARIEAEVRLRDAHEEAIRSQARRVAFQVVSGQQGERPHDHTWTSGEEDDVPVTCWRVSVRNATSDPVRDVLLWISLQGHPTLVDACLFDVVGPDEVVRADSGARPEIIQARPEYRAQFTDAAGRRWEVRQDGDLRQI